MRGIKSQRILLIVGFFLLAVSSLHPINHIASDDQNATAGRFRQLLADYEAIRAA